MNIQKGYGEYDEAPKNCTIDQINSSEKEDTLLNYYTETKRKER